MGAPCVPASFTTPSEVRGGVPVFQTRGLRPGGFQLLVQGPKLAGRQEAARPGLIIVLFVKWAVAPRKNVECISEFVISDIILLKAYILLFLSNYKVSCILAFYRLVNIFIISYYNIYLLYINLYLYINIFTLYNIFINSLKYL